MEERQVIKEFRGKYGNVTFVKSKNQLTKDEYRGFCKFVVESLIKKQIANNTN